MTQLFRYRLASSSLNRSQPLGSNRPITDRSPAISVLPCFSCIYLYPCLSSVFNTYPNLILSSGSGSSPRSLPSWLSKKHLFWYLFCQHEHFNVFLSTWVQKDLRYVARVALNTKLLLLLGFMPLFYILGHQHHFRQRV